MGQESGRRTSSGEGRGSGRSVQGGGIGARCGGPADAACRHCITDALLRFWAGSSYGGRGMASPSSSGTVGRAGMVSTVARVCGSVACRG